MIILSHRVMCLIQHQRCHFVRDKWSRISCGRNFERIRCDIALLTKSVFSGRLKQNNAERVVHLKPIARQGTVITFTPWDQWIVSQMWSVLVSNQWTKMRLRVEIINVDSLKGKRREISEILEKMSRWCTVVVVKC